MADEVIRDLMENNLLEATNRILFSLEKNNSIAEGLPPSLQNFLTQTSQLPSWADPKKLRKAQELFSLYGLEISLILFCKSLPQSYCCPKGVKVLHSTGRLSQDPTFNKFTRRVMETSKFVMNVLSENSFESEGSAIVTIQKVRLLHASIRYYLKKHHWDSENLGQPINQQDMIGTLMSFSALVIEGLEMLNINWNNEEKDAYIHCWNVAGYILGVKPEFLPANYDEALSLGNLIFDDQKGYSKEGQEMAEALVSFIHYILPGNLLDGMAENMICFLLGEENIKFIGLKKEEDFLEKKLPIIYKLLGGISDDLKDHSLLIKTIAKPFSKMILQGILLSYNDHKGAVILIPPSLQENWQLKTIWKNILTSPALFGKRFTIQKNANSFD